MSYSSILSEKANAILAQFPGPVAIRPSKWKMLALFSPVFLLSAVAAIGILWPSPLQLKESLIIGGFVGGSLVADCYANSNFVRQGRAANNARFGRIFADGPTRFGMEALAGCNLL